MSKFKSFGLAAFFSLTSTFAVYGQTCDQTFKGSWFDIDYPSGFQSELLDTGSHYDDAAWFRSIDYKLDLYIHSPQWTGFDLPSQVGEGEELLSESVDSNVPRKVTFLAIRDSEKYIRNLRITENSLGPTKWVIGFRTKNGSLSAKQKLIYNCFKESLVQYAD